MSEEVQAPASQREQHEQLRAAAESVAAVLVAVAQPDRNAAYGCFQSLLADALLRRAP